MATYKVIQDIEAEDKLVGPLGFRQFVYFLIAAFLGYLSFISVASGAALFLVVLVPPMLFCLFFAWPWTPDQPTEVWALARIRFLVKSRKRVWNQSGVKEFVTITVPKKIERNYTDGLSQVEVRSRLRALASTIDSRGWAVKNANLNDAAKYQILAGDSDRLISLSSMPQAVPDVDVRPDDDILDDANNPLASHMTDMLSASTKARRQGLLERLRMGAAAEAPATANKQWFAPVTPGVLPSVMPAVGVQAPAAAAEPVLPAPRPTPNSHLKTLQPASDQPAASAPAPLPDPVSTSVTTSAPEPVQPAVKTPTNTPSDAAILNLAHDNNLDVATLAREAHKVRSLEDSDGEVVVSLR